MKKMLSLIISLLMVMTSLFAVPFSAQAATENAIQLADNSDGNSAGAIDEINSSIKVTFNGNGGTPALTEVYTDENGKIQNAPEPTNPPFGFFGWYENAEHSGSKVDLNTTTFSENKTLYAAWVSRIEFNACTGGGESINDIYAPSWMSGLRFAGETITMKALPGEGYRFVKWAKGSQDGETFSTDAETTYINDGTISKFYALFMEQRNVNFNSNGGTTGTNWKDSQPIDINANLNTLLSSTVPEAPDESVVKPPAGKYFDGYDITVGGGETITLKPGDTIDIAVTDVTNVEYRWAYPVVTVHWSSIDGVDLMPAKTYEVPAGLTLKEALEQIGIAHNHKFFEKEGYQEMGIRLPKPMGEYPHTLNSIAQHVVDGAAVNNTIVGKDGLEFYCVLFKILPPLASVEIKAPICGVTTTAEFNEQGEWTNQTNQPIAILPEDVHYTVSDQGLTFTGWLNQAQLESEPFIGTFKGGESYYAGVLAVVEYGYMFADGNFTFTINGTTPFDLRSAKSGGGGVVSLTANHVAGEEKIENLAKATCTEDGGYDEVVRCTGCNDILESKHVKTEDALGHKYGTKGTSRFTCTVCGTVDEAKKAEAEKADKEAADKAAAEAKAVAEKAEAEFAAGVEVKAEKDGATIGWQKAPEAKRYVIYATYCGKKKFKKIKTVDGEITSFKITKLNGKKINTKKNMKVYIVAEKRVDGKWVKLLKSPTFHIAGKKSKNTNVKKISVKKAKYTLAKGKTAKIKAKLVLENKKKKPINHVRKFRYMSTNTAVATVSKSGKIKAVGEGTATIYVFSNNGTPKAIKVTVI